MSDKQPHVVLGAGQIGSKVAQLLLADGHEVVLCRRSAQPPPIRGLSITAVDLRNAAEVARLTANAAAVYHCASPAYHRWHEELIPLTRGIAEGTRKSHAHLVVIDNLYMYGETAHLDETSPIAPVSRKGRFRAEAAAILLDAGAAIGRAPEFFGPDTPTTVFGDAFWKRILAGKTAQVFGDPDQPHSYSFSPDVARSLVALGTRPGSNGVWMLPTLPAESTRSVIARFAAALGRNVAIQTVPTAMLRVMGLFSPMLRELAEMTYQWKQPFIVHSDNFQREFFIDPTPWSDAVAQTVMWARSQGNRR